MNSQVFIVTVMLYNTGLIKVLLKHLNMTNMDLRPFDNGFKKLFP